MARLFLAVWPPPSVVRALTALPRPPADGVRWTAPDRWHLTLRFLGDTDPAPVMARLEGVHLPTAQVQLGPAVTLLGPRVVVVPAEGLEGLAAVVVAATRDVGRPPEDRPFRGHLTLARLRPPGTCPLVGASVRLSFAVEEVVLVASTPRLEGPTYDILARWPVRR